MRGQSGEVEAMCASTDDEFSFWVAQLPPFEEGISVEYSFHALPAVSGAGAISTETFGYVVSGWHKAGRVREVREIEGALLLTCESSSGPPDVPVRLAFSDDTTLQLRIGPAGTSGQPAPRPRPRPRPRPGPGGSGRHPAGAQSYRIVERSEKELTLATGGVRVRIGLDRFSLAVTLPDGESVLSTEPEGIRLLFTGESGVRKIACEFKSPDEEAFIGFGERFNALNQRGHVLDVLVYEQYKGQAERTYMPVPFFISSEGYGLYLDTSGYVTYDLAASAQDKWSFAAGVADVAGVAGVAGVADVGGTGAAGVSGTGAAGVSGTGAAYLDCYLFVGTPKEALGGFTALTGRPALPPEWAFGPWMSGNEWNSQQSVLEQVRLTHEHDIPATVFVIEAWSDETTFYIWNDAQYSPKAPGEPFSYSDFTFPAHGKWPDPKGMVDYLHERGIRLLLWQVPVLKASEVPHAQRDLDEAYMIRNGYCVREVSGKPYRVRPFWFRGGLVPDFTNSEAERWWLSRRLYLLDEVCIDGFKTDGGEHLWGQDLAFADGRTSAEVSNLYPVLYTGAYHRFAREKRGEAITFSRSGFTGCQAYPCHWAGDEDSTWEAFRSSILAGLSAGASGIPFWGWDLAGFSGEIPSAELYLRATAMACFCPIMQYHSEYNEHRLPSRDRTPWNIQERTGDPDVIPVFRRYAQLRMHLLPYLYEEARKAAQTGVPLMRALAIEYPGDPQVYNYPYQYHLGDAFLVAPVVTEGATHQAVYLPKGEWEDFWTGERHAGPVLTDYATPKDVIPVFVRPGASEYDPRSG
jgi:alpha-glucosidase (family GH31 glycosyl hydrolase)